MATPGEFIAALKDYVGVPYVWGGKTAKGLDCSGLITLALADVGVRFVHGSANQIAATSAISVDKAWRTPGALLYRPGHDAISLGNNKAIEAIRPRVAITNRTATLDGKPRFTRAGLITALSSTTGAAVSTMVSPFEGRYTSAYDPNRWITYNGKRIFSPHRGLDVAPPVPGTVGGAVRASFAGTVEEAVSWAQPGNRASTWAPGRTGNGCKIRNTDGAAQGYNHMRPVVRKGEWVAAGQIIGYLDKSGQITGPHLHFETWANWRNPDSAYNPKILFDKYGIEIGSAPDISGGGSPEKEEWFDMDKEVFREEMDAALNRFYRKDWISVGGELGEKYKGGQASLYELTREAAYAREEIRKALLEKYPIYGALKNYTGGEEMNLIQMARYGATAMPDGRNQYARIMAELSGLEAGMSALAKAIESGSAPDLDVEDILNQIHAAAQMAAEKAMPDEVVVPLETEE